MSTRRGVVSLLAIVGWLVGLGAVTSRPRADPAPRSGPLRIAIECQGYGRTKACPDFLLGFVEANSVLLASPRANADVILYVNAVGIANADRLHLRYVGDVRGAPASIEVDVDVDTRGADDAQRAQLEPAFLRGVALYVAALHPDAVTVALAALAAGPAAAAATSPWGANLQLNAFGSWSGPYRSGNGAARAELTRVLPTSRFKASVGANGGLSRQPPVGGVSFNTTRWGMSAGAAYDHHLNHCYAVEFASSTWRDDPKGQFRFGWDGNVGLEWDRFPSDDPRGNVLAVAYFIGYRVEGYNFRNVIGERFAQYPLQRLVASGSLRQDKISYDLNLEVNGEVLHPTRRYTLSASPGAEIQLGDHVDLELSFSVTQRQLPEFVIPDDDPEAIGRAEYAESLSMSGYASVRIHWDATNGVRNNRFVNN
ncbi:MAG: hypothetical protein R3B06_14500 [Kofleriaceae bacterium]